MIAEPVAKLLATNLSDFLIPAELVATLRTSNNLQHAFMVLTKVRYAKIPVLDDAGKFAGLVSLPLITNTMLGLQEIDGRHLSKQTVAEVMETDVPTLHLPYDYERILHLLVDNAFLVVVDDAGQFTGIVTRREILKGINKTIHAIK